MPSATRTVPLIRGPTSTWIESSWLSPVTWKESFHGNVRPPSRTWILTLYVPGLRIVLKNPFCDVRDSRPTRHRSWRAKILEHKREVDPEHPQQERRRNPASTCGLHTIGNVLPEGNVALVDVHSVGAQPFEKDLVSRVAGSTSSKIADSKCRSVG